MVRIDALLTRLPNEIMDKGFANFSTDEGRDGSFVMNAGICFLRAATVKWKMIFFISKK